MTARKQTKRSFRAVNNMTLNPAAAQAVLPVTHLVAAAVAATFAATVVAPIPTPVMIPAARASATLPDAAAIPVPAVPAPCPVQPMADVQLAAQPFQIPVSWANTAGPSMSPPHNPQRSRSPVRRGQCLPAPMRWAQLISSWLNPDLPCSSPRSTSFDAGSWLTTTHFQKT